MLNHLDTELLLTLNGLLRTYFWLPKAVSGLALNPIARCVPVFVPLVVLWFSPNHIARRGHMALGLAGVCFATLISVLLQKHLHLNIRPASWALEPSICSPAFRWSPIGSSIIWNGRKPANRGFMPPCSCFWRMPIVNSRA